MNNTPNKKNRFKIEILYPGSNKGAIDPTFYPILIKRDSKYFYFGTLCITDYGKIIFFPGLITFNSRFNNLQFH